MSGLRECGVCWYVYDPAQGDDVWQVPPGTGFDQLPEAWRCPRCDSGKDRFLPPRDLAPDPRLSQLERAYRTIADEKMRDLPFVNPKLQVATVSFRELDGGLFGALVTPWSITAVYLPPAGTPPAPPLGHNRRLPAGDFWFFPQTLDGVGALEQASIFSPVLEFEDQASALAAATTRIELMATPPPKPSPPSTSRRALLGLLRR